MSGPKVVRIVTREEIQAICRGLVKAFDLAAEELVRQARRYGLLDETIDNDISVRREQLMAHFHGDRWREVQKLAPALTKYLIAEGQRLRAQALAQAEMARSKRRHVSDSARSLIANLEASGSPVTDTLREIAQTALRASDESLISMEAIVQQELRRVSGADDRLTENEDLAQRLGVGNKDLTFAEWKARRPITQLGIANARLDKLLAEIEVNESSDVAEEFAERAFKISGESSPERRALLTDSLILDAAESARNRRDKDNLLSKLRETRGALEGLATERALSLASRIAQAIEARETSDAPRLITEGKELCENETHILAAAARRRAILSGLSSLGYEVKDGMMTSWVRDGRILLKKPGTSDYGVELGAPADASRLQIRLVGSDRPATPRSTRRDRDQETIWCSEFTKLQGLIAKSNGELILEHAEPVGAVAVKSVPMASSGENLREVDAPLGARTVQ